MTEVTCSRVNKSGKDLRVGVVARTHTIIIDALSEDGGTDQAPTPHEILAASLAACTSITVQMYANRKAWPLTSADVTVRLSKSAKSLSAVEEGEAITAIPTSNFDVTISLQGDLLTEQRERLLEIANKCPVHKVLAGAVGIKVTLV